MHVFKNQEEGNPSYRIGVQGAMFSFVVEDGSLMYDYADGLDEAVSAAAAAFATSLGVPLASVTKWTTAYDALYEV